MSTPKKQPAGFTLVELVVTTVIIGLMAGLALADYRTAGNRTILHLETQKFAGDIRWAQNMALGAIDYNGTTPPGGWGVYVASAGAYYIFADNDANGRYSAGGDAVIQTVALSPRVVFSAGVGVSVVYRPPNPSVSIYNGGPVSAVTVTLRQANDPGAARDVVLNDFGLVDPQ